MESLSDRIVRENLADFAAMCGHRFVRDIQNGEMSKPVFDRYLGLECAFVETAISIFAYLTAKAPSLDRQQALIRVLTGLANDQMPYFDKAFAARGVARDDADTGQEAVAAFRDGMLAIARDGNYLDGITAMFGAEWMYWTWCMETVPDRIDDPVIADWVLLHTGRAFRDQAHWLKAEIDAAAPGLSEDEAARLSDIFGRVQRLEIAFHSAAYG